MSWKYTDDTNRVVSRITIDGSMESCLASVLLEGTEILPADLPNPIEVEKQRIASLWQAAHDYEYAEISGSAIGLLALGVIQGKTKCLAVQTWIQGIWTEYYTRKTNGSTDTDFSLCGPCPHTVPELMTELGL